MKIVADENIPFVHEAFSNLGEVTTCSGREMSNNNVRDADVLLVRSITKVNEALLEGSHIQFVATATIGTDHINFNALKKRNITFASAPGSNAESVTQYITAALLAMAQSHSFSLQEKTIGIIGNGNVGSRVARNATAMGMNLLLYDPPLARETGDAKYLPLEALYEADFITLHTPLVTEGEEPTFHLVDTDFLQKMKPSAILINTSRGAVIDNNALLHRLQQKQIAGAVLDVWENEPNISTELLKHVEIGTPHIAGYSFDGKVRGTKMIYEAVCHYFEIAPDWNEQQTMPAADVPHLTIQTNNKTVEQIFTEALLPIYRISKDDHQMRKLLNLPKSEQGVLFDHLRKRYPRRREFCNTKISLEPHSSNLAKRLQELQFDVT